MKEIVDAIAQVIAQVSSPEWNEMEELERINAKYQVRAVGEVLRTLPDETVDYLISVLEDDGWDEMIGEMLDEA